MVIITLRKELHRSVRQRLHFIDNGTHEVHSLPAGLDHLAALFGLHDNQDTTLPGRAEVIV